MSLAKALRGAAASVAALALLLSCGEEDLGVTSPHLAVSSLNAQIESNERLLAGDASRFAARKALVELLVFRAGFLGTFDDFDRVVALSDEGVTLHPAEAAAYALRAHARSALHRFSEALADWQEAESRGHPADRVAAGRATVYLAIGQNLDWVREVRLREVAAWRSFTNLSNLAAVEGELGNHAESGRLFAEALVNYRDVSPFPYAWTHFQRGVMWAEKAGDAEAGREDYRLATRYFPDYVVANVHLAEREAEEGDVDAAVWRLRHVARFTGDPEPKGLLSELLAARGETAEAETLAREAKERYDVLLAKHEAAFRDHGAEFFMGPGEDPPRALQLALANLASRKNERAYTIAIEAAAAAGDEAKRCELVTEAEARSPKTIPLQEAVVANKAGC